MNKIFKNSILVLFILFSVNNGVLANERTFPDGELVRMDILEQIKTAIDAVCLHFHNKKERSDMEQSNLDILNKMNKPPKGNEYMKMAFNDLEVKNRVRYKEAESRKLTETQDYLNKNLSNILTLEQELNIEIEHHPEVQNFINKNPFLKQIVSKK